MDRVIIRQLIFIWDMASFDNWIRWEIGRTPLKKGGKRKWDYRDNYEDIAMMKSMMIPIILFHLLGAFSAQRSRT